MSENLVPGLERGHLWMNNKDIMAKEAFPFECFSSCFECPPGNRAPNSGVRSGTGSQRARETVHRIRLGSRASKPSRVQTDHSPGKGWHTLPVAHCPYLQEETTVENELAPPSPKTSATRSESQIHAHLSAALSGHRTLLGAHSPSELGG